MSPSEGQARLELLSPTQDELLDVPAATVVLRFPAHSQVRLWVNGQAVGEESIGRTSLDESTDLVTQTWYGISLQSGRNEIQAEGLIQGEQQRVSTAVTVRGAARAISLTTLEARLPADGRSLVTVQGQLLDGNGNRSNDSAIVTLSANAGLFVGEDFSLGQPGFQVQAQDGEFTAQLQAPLEAGIGRIRADSAGLEAYSQIQFETGDRPSIVSGLLDLRLGRQGLDFYDRFEDFDLSQDNDLGLEAEGQLFATGNIGEWLFTGAYNSKRPLNEDERGENLYEATDQFSDYLYPVHGDGSSSYNLTPSIDHFYARIERTPDIPGAAPDFLLWGDYNTEEFASPSQEFSATSRNLHGAKLNYNLGNLQLSGFYGNNVDGFGRDIIAPDGTSGYYFLSQRLLLPGSEELYIELEELERPGTIIERSRLSRGSDYDIDYDRGSIQFREAQLRTAIGDQGQVLVRRIVASYQFESGESASIYGLRGRYHLSRETQNESWIGATALREDKGSRDFSLYGADALFSLGADRRLVAEYAYSENDSPDLGNVDGSAYRVELEGKLIENVTGRAYLRHADAGFSNNATISFVPGQTRYGAEVKAKVGSTTSLRLGYDHEKNDGVSTRPIVTLGDLLDATNQALPGQRVDNRLTTVTAGVQQQLGRANLNLDLVFRDRQDRLNPDRSGSSSQLRSRLALPLGERLSFNALNELTLSSNNDAVYSDRTQVGLSYKIMPGIDLGLNQHWFTRGQFNGQSFTTLDLQGEYALLSGDRFNTTLTGRYSLVNGLSEMRGQGALGLKQRWEVTRGLNLDLAYERIVGDMFGRTASGDRLRQPIVVGSNSSTVGLNGGDSFSLGLDYTGSADLKASARYERSNSSGGTSENISAALTGKLSPSLTGLVRYNRSANANQGLRNLDPTTEIRLGLAYRDVEEDKINALLRYEYRRNPDLIPESALFGSGTGSSEHVFATEAIYAPNWRWELYGKLALRQSESYLAEDLVGSNTTTLAQLRATYRFHDSFDLLGEGRWIGQTQGYQEMGVVLEGGYYITPDLRLSAGYVFGKVSDRDFDGNQSASGPYVGITLKVNELFRGFGEQTPVAKPVTPNSNPEETPEAEPMPTNIPSPTEAAP
ncbi:MAG: TonB-dependent receptor [Synechococcales cyanobacterium RM1_1_8]|nr:TonB-dependent receptor [Synechococcales cyanobacterium RM1_1_8]